ncbi:MAG: hypothetical protein IK020_00845 [Clostridiales bacterium]|nr:hypothetical protein [Clostridiales bacterium]
MKKIYAWEPWFFLFFGVFHMHRIWALVARESYASFWMGIMEEKGAFYFILMGILALLCVVGIITFVRERKNNYWWRWIYLCGGAYVLFDLFAIATGMAFWQDILNKMFDTKSSYWNLIWGFFILLGTAVFALGIKLLRKSHSDRYRKTDQDG